MRVKWKFCDQNFRFSCWRFFYLNWNPQLTSHWISSHGQMTVSQSVVRFEIRSFIHFFARVQLIFQCGVCILFATIFWWRGRLLWIQSNKRMKCKTKKTMKRDGNVVSLKGVKGCFGGIKFCVNHQNNILSTITEVVNPKAFPDDGTNGTSNVDIFRRTLEWQNVKQFKLDFFVLIALAFCSFSDKI